MNTRIIFAAFFLMLGTFLPAQDSLRCLILEKFYNGKISPHSKPVIVPEGSKIYIQTNLSVKPLTGKLQIVNDSVIRVDSTTIAMREVNEVGWWTDVLDSGRAPAGKIIGGIFMGLGTVAIAPLPFAFARGSITEVVAALILAGYGAAAVLIGTAIFATSKSREGSLHKRKIGSTYKVHVGTVSKKEEEKKRAHW
jgi:hypothetical protein